MIHFVHHCHVVCILYLVRAGGFNAKYGYVPIQTPIVLCILWNRITHSFSFYNHMGENPMHEVRNEICRHPLVRDKM